MGEAAGAVGYPRTLAEFNAWFPDEAACLAYLARLRWPGGFVFHRLLEQAMQVEHVPISNLVGGKQS